MKQHITKQQLDELSELGKINLEKEIISSNYEVACYEDICLPLLSIGQMIEFLKKNNERDAINRLSCYRHTVMQGDMEWEEYSHLDDLCDDLWRDVKEVLSKE